MVWYGRYGSINGVADRPVWPADRSGGGWPRLEAALSLSWRWRGALQGESAEAPGRMVSTWACACWRRGARRRRCGRRRRRQVASVRYAGDGCGWPSRGARRVAQKFQRSLGW
eukprot:scaffold45359_cov60-Phaeocystis_antarctica.AAC.2